MRPLVRASLQSGVSSVCLACACLSGALLPSGAAALRQGPGGTLPIQVSAAPSRTLVGGAVQLKGSTGFTGASSAVSLRIQPPGTAPAVVLTAKVGSGGSFSAVFTQTNQVGTYAVQATAPDKKGQASTVFRVVPVEAIPAEIGHAADSLVNVSNQAIQLVRQGVAALPPTPERAEAEKRLTTIQQRMAVLPAQTAILTQQMQKVFKARAQVPQDNPQWDAYVEKLNEWQTDASAHAANLRVRIQSASAETERCGRLDTYNEMLTATAEGLDLIVAPFDLSQTFWIDKIPGAFVARSPAAGDLKPETKFLAIETMKVGASALGGPLALVNAIPGLVVDAAAFLVQQEFSKYCQQLEGPISATFLGESFTTKGERFFDYTTVLDGKLVLMYDKSASTAKPIGVLGYMEGNGRFTVRDNPAPIIRIAPGTVLFHKVLSPPGSGYTNEIGQAARSLLPHSFRVPVKGTLAGDSVVLALGPAVHDFSDAIQGQTVYVIMPLGGMVPQIIVSKIPLQKAYPMLDRVIRGHPVLHLTYVGGTRAEGTFARDTTNAQKTARVRTQLKIRACSPSCLITPLIQPKGKP